MPSNHDVSTGSGPRAGTGTAAEPPGGVSIRAVGVLAALALAAFAYGTTENLPIGLLPLIADDLGVSHSATGHLVAWYAVTVVIVSVPLTYLTRRVPRRALLSVLLTGFVATTLVSAAAGDYWILLGARIVGALSQALFWAVVAPTAAGMFPARVRGKVIATVFSGGSLAMVLGVPAGTWIGQQAGWRVAFLVLSGVGLATLAVVALLLPNVAPGNDHAAVGTSPDTRRYWLLIAVTAFAITGVFTAYTYIAVLLTEVTGFPEPAVAPVLFAQGLADLVGVASFGVFADRRPRAALIVPAGLMTAALLGLYAFAEVRVLTVGLLVLVGFSLAGVPTAMQNRIMEVAPGSTDMASAGSSAAFNVGIAGGAYLGAVLLPEFGVRSTPLAGGLLAGVALLLVLAEPILARRPGRGTGAEHWAR